MIQPAARTWRKKQILDLQSSWRKSHLNWPLRGRQVGCFFFNQRIISLQGWVGFSCKTVSISYTYTHIPSLLILPPLHPTPTSQSTELRSLCYQQLPTSCLFYTWWSIHCQCCSPNSSQPLLPLLCPAVCSLHMGRCFYLLL